MSGGFRDLEVWNLAMNLAQQSYELTKSFPKDELFGMVSQIRRSAVSVPANIAEGYGRYATRDYLRFLSVAQGSLAELETHLELAVRVGLVAIGPSKDLLATASRVGQMLIALRRSLKRKLGSETV